MNPLTNLSIFSGIAGIEIAAEQAGFTTVGQVELADYPFLGSSKALPRHTQMEGY